MKPIYLDYAATTPVDKRVAEKMIQYLMMDGSFGNPASLHHYGKEAHLAIELAREQVASVIDAHPSEIIWTSGATESDNLALKGAAQLLQHKGKHIITMSTEHKAVLDSCAFLEKSGFTVSYLSPQKNGLLDLALLKETIRKDTILISTMHVNNETGIVQNLAEIAAITSERGILFHVDAAQSMGKISLKVTDMPIDLLSLSAHKVYGPKGIGALYLRKKPRVRVEPLLHGGGHEQGMRSGTLATHQIVGMGEAFALLEENELKKEIHFIKNLRERFLQGLKKINNISLNHDLTLSVPNILNVRFEGMIADAILDQLPIAASTSSACIGKVGGSYVLRAMGFHTEEVQSSIRFSLGRFTQESDIDAAIQAIHQVFSIQ